MYFVISGIWSGFVFQEVTFLSRFLGVFSVSIPMFMLAILCSGGLGGGDVKLMAASGVLLGIKVEYICCLCGITFRRIIWIFSTDYKACEAKGLLCAGTFFCGIGIAVVFFRYIFYESVREII